MIGALSPGSGPVSAEGASPARLTKAAGEFEALLLGQMLKAAFARPDGELDQAGQAGGAVMEMGSECLAQAIASAGGLGLNTMIVRGLETTSAGHRAEPGENQRQR